MDFRDPLAENEEASDKSETSTFAACPPPDPGAATYEEVCDVASSKPTKSPAFQFYPNEFLGSTKVQLMSSAEVGAYMLLLCACWLDNGIPNDMTRMAKIARMAPKAFKASWDSVLSECFHLRGERFHNARLDRERKKQADYRKLQQEKAEKKWEKERTMPRHTPGIDSAASGQMPDACSSIPSSSSFPSPSAETHTRQAPLHSNAHRSHASCGRVCVPAFLHDEFRSERNHDDADQELRFWYLSVHAEWGTGAKQQEPTGGDGVKFWRARYAERWPAKVAAPIASSKLPAWAQRAQANRGLTS